MVLVMLSTEILVMSWVGTSQVYTTPSVTSISDIRGLCIGWGLDWMAYKCGSKSKAMLWSHNVVIKPIFIQTPS